MGKERSLEDYERDIEEIFAKHGEGDFTIELGGLSEDQLSSLYERLEDKYVVMPRKVIPPIFYGKSEEERNYTLHVRRRTEDA